MESWLGACWQERWAGYLEYGSALDNDLHEKLKQKSVIFFGYYLHE